MKTKNTIDIFIVNEDKKFSTTLKLKIQSFFNNSNIQMTVFESGEACLEKLKSLHPNIVIMDYHLESDNENLINGVETLKRLKKISPSTDVVMLTNEQSIESALDALVNGASNYVLKTDAVFRNVIKTINSTFKMRNINLEGMIYNAKYPSLIIGFMIISYLITTFMIHPSVFTLSFR